MAEVSAKAPVVFIAIDCASIRDKLINSSEAAKANLAKRPIEIVLEDWILLGVSVFHDKKRYALNTPHLKCSIASGEKQFFIKKN